MNAVQLLRAMHADTKFRFKIILGTPDPAAAASQWQALQPLLALHEELEDEFLYTPLFQEMGPGSPLGDWDLQHEADVAIVQQLISATADHQPGTPEWRMSVARVMDTLSKHVMDEEGQIFGRIEQVWSAERLEAAGASMQQMLASRGQDNPPGAARVRPTRARAAAKPAPARRGR